MCDVANLELWRSELLGGGIFHDFINRLLLGLLTPSFLDEPDDWLTGEDGLREHLVEKGPRLPYYSDYVRSDVVPWFEDLCQAEGHREMAVTYDEVIDSCPSDLLDRMDYVVSVIRATTSVAPEHVNFETLKYFIVLGLVIVRGALAVEDVTRLGLPWEQLYGEAIGVLPMPSRYNYGAQERALPEMTVHHAA